MTSLSIIMPVYNSEKYLQAALDSLLRNWETNYELIAVIDGSRDSSLQILLKYASKIKNLNIIELKKNQGYGNACNCGIEKAKGKYIAFFEPDDLIEDNFYKELLTENDDADIVKYNGMYQFYDQDQKTKIRLFRYKNIPRKKLNYREYPRIWRSHPSVVNCIYKKEFLNVNEIRFCTGMGASYQDVQFNVRLFYSKPTIKLIDNCKYLYRRHSSQSTKNISSDRISAVIFNWEMEEKFEASKIQDWDYFNLQWYRHWFSLIKSCQKKERKVILKYLLNNSKNKKISKLFFKFINIDKKCIIKYYILRSISCLLNII